MREQSWGRRGELCLMSCYILWRLLIYCSYSVLVRISSDITKPRKGRESEGVFSIVSELNNMASPAVENGRYGYAQCVEVYGSTNSGGCLDSLSSKRISRACSIKSPVNQMPWKQSLFV